ncbi:MAG: 1,4-alpha-glucan branching protein GlgB, partial [Candidatus Omnitrophica bacterium]|nr:1,4-alpha-glucan branching protein GlgB [Candidatus Omnitrophota bacterium]
QAYRQAGAKGEASINLILSSVVLISLVLVVYWGLVMHFISPSSPQDIWKQIISHPVITASIAVAAIAYYIYAHIRKNNKAGLAGSGTGYVPVSTADMIGWNAFLLSAILYLCGGLIKHYSGLISVLLRKPSGKFHKSNLNFYAEQYGEFARPAYLIISPRIVLRFSGNKQVNDESRYVRAVLVELGNKYGASLPIYFGRPIPLLFRLLVKRIQQDNPRYDLNVDKLTAQDWKGILETYLPSQPLTLRMTEFLVAFIMPTIYICPEAKQAIWQIIQERQEGEDKTLRGLNGNLSLEHIQIIEEYLRNKNKENVPVRGDAGVFNGEYIFMALPVLAGLPQVFVYARLKNGTLEIYLSKEACEILDKIFRSNPRHLAVAYEAIFRHEYAETVLGRPHELADLIMKRFLYNHPEVAGELECLTQPRDHKNSEHSLLIVTSTSPRFELMIPVEYPGSVLLELVKRERDTIWKALNRKRLILAYLLLFQADVGYDDLKAEIKELREHHLRLGETIRRIENEIDPDQGRSPDNARSKTGERLTEKQVAADIGQQKDKIRTLNAAEYQQAIEESEKIKSFLAATGRTQWMVKLQELLADNGRLRAGPFRSISGAVYENVLYLDEPVLQNPSEFALTLLHELGKIMGQPHRKNLALEKEYLNSRKEINDSLGLILAVNPLDTGAKLSGQARIAVDGASITGNMEKLVDLLGKFTFNRALYLMGLFKTSGISRLVHGLDYDQICSYNSDDLKAYLEEKREELGLDKETQILETKPLNACHLYLSLQTGANRVSTIIGYHTKQKTYIYKGKNMVHSEKWGNYFSPIPGVLNPYIDEEQLKKVARKARDRQIKLIYDFVPWSSLDSLNNKNYKYFAHKAVQNDKSDEQVLEEENCPGAVLHLEDGSRVFIYNRREAQDQLLMDLGARTEQGAYYWEEAYSNYLRYVIDNFDADGFRVDLAFALQKNNDYSLIKRVFFDAIEYASKTKNKRIYFVLEVYSREARDMFRGWNREAGYCAFKTYYEDVFANLLAKKAAYLEYSFNWVLNCREAKMAEVIYASNYDEFSLRDILQNETIRREAISMFLLLAISGCNVLFYMRDFLELEGDIIPVAGGQVNSSNEFVTHKFSSDREFKKRVSAGLVSMFKASFSYEKLARLNEYGAQNIEVGSRKLTAHLAKKSGKIELLEFSLEDICSSGSGEKLVSATPRSLEEALAALDKLKKENSHLIRECSHFKKKYLQANEEKLVDALTGAYNRRYLDKHLPLEIMKAKRHEYLLLLLMIDIDHFKAVNDTYGHDVGDVVLKAVSEAIKGALRETDTLIRYGGEEFVVFMPYMSKAKMIEKAESVRTAVEKAMIRIEIDGGKKTQIIRATVSVGVAAASTPKKEAWYTVKEAAKDAQSLIKEADTAMYAAKHRGRNRIEIFEEAIALPKKEEPLNAYSGHYNARLDEKNRVIVPSAFVKTMPGITELYLHYNTKNKSVEIYSRDAYNKKAGALGEEARIKFNGLSFQAQLDKQGRILIGKNLARLLGLRKEVIFVGSGEHIQLWPKKSWYKFSGINSFAKDTSRSKTGAPLTEAQVLGEIEQEQPRIRMLRSFGDTEDSALIGLAAAKIKKFLIDTDREQWIIKLEEMLAGEGKLRAGPFKLFFGTVYQGVLYLDESILSNKAELAVTILHELGAVSGLSHQENLRLEDDFIRAVFTKPVKLALYSTGVNIAFGTSGWRGKLDKDFVLANVRRAAQGVAEYHRRHIKKGKILIGYDPRKGNVEFAHETASILSGNGIPVKIIIEEPTPSPVLGYLVNSDSKLKAAINFTASHNRYTDDGFKFYPYHGGVADKETTDLISNYANTAVTYRYLNYKIAKKEGLIEEMPFKEAASKYVSKYLIAKLREIGAWDSILKYVKESVPFNIVLDPMQGTAVKYLDMLYRQIEKEAGSSFVKLIHTANQDPAFSQVNGAPNPTEKEFNQELVSSVNRDNHTLGLATDGDGDRFGVVDFGGKEISANEVIAMLAFFFFRKGFRGAVGKSVATSNFANAVCEYCELELVETQVGFKWFVDKAINADKKFLVAGEESAHVAVGPFMRSWDDGIVIGLMCLWMAAESRLSLSGYKEEIERIIGKAVVYKRDNLELNEDLKSQALKLIEQVKLDRKTYASFEDFSISRKMRALDVKEKVSEIITLDGIKVIFDTGDWLCIRISGTENVARLYTEVTDISRQERLRNIGKELLGVSAPIELCSLMQAAGKQSREQIGQGNIFREIGFDGQDSRLGWVLPPSWPAVEEALNKFLSLDAVKNKDTFIFSGMGGSVNTIKALIGVVKGQDRFKIYTIDSLDRAALSGLLACLPDLSQTLIVGISKSGTTKETQDILKALKEKVLSQGLDYRKHFLWLADLPNKAKIENAGWQGIGILPIQIDGRTDIGGRFTAPHTLIFLLPLLLLMDKDIAGLKLVWDEYLVLRNKLIVQAVNKANQSAATQAQHFAVLLEERSVNALETWITQLIQESLGGKSDTVNPKTFVVTPENIPAGFETVSFDVPASFVLNTMLNMYLLQIFAAVYSCNKKMNFVNQPEVENYKKKMKEVSGQDIPRGERVSIAGLIQKIGNVLRESPQIRFLEVVCYWYLKEEEKRALEKVLKSAFSGKDIIVFQGSDWNHHSYQAASKNKESLFVVLTRAADKAGVSGIKEETLKQNDETLRTIAYATYLTLQDKGLYFEMSTDAASKEEIIVVVKEACGVPLKTPAVFEDKLREELERLKFTEFDSHLFTAEGKHCEVYGKLGAHPVFIDGVTAGVHFSVWAPNAKSISVIGDFNNWDHKRNVMHNVESRGVWRCFIPEAKKSDFYKYYVVGNDGNARVKVDPYAFASQYPEDGELDRNASIVWDLSYNWHDDSWMDVRQKKQALDQPISVYEVHLGSWRKIYENGRWRWMNYREVAPMLAEYVLDMGFTHVELMPVNEHYYYPSWGYQVNNYFAPTSRYGSPQDFMYLVDYLHQKNIGVILDVVYAHFAEHGSGLAEFDGTELYSHLHPFQGKHEKWGTRVFNFGRHEVKSFLISNAFYWLEKYHVDGLRLDAVACMLYLNYDREEGKWIPNCRGDSLNLEGISFIKELNEAIRCKYFGALTIAEDSSHYYGVTRPVSEGGLGFSMKQSIGWMRHTLDYMKKDTLFRQFHHGELYKYPGFFFYENFVLPLSHDEAVHGKCSLLEKMPGDRWQKFANLRLLLGLMFTESGKKHLFMGGEIAEYKEWNHDTSVDWSLLNFPQHKGIQDMVRDLNRIYRSEPALYQRDFSDNGFEKVDFNDWEKSVISYVRRGENPDESVLVVFNFKPVLHKGYRIGVSWLGEWQEIFNSDASCYGGSNVGNGGKVYAAMQPMHNRLFSVSLTLPPLGMVILKGVRQPASLHTSRFMVQKFAQELENAREDASYGVSLKIDNGNLSCQGKDLPSPLKERLGGALKIISFLKNSDPRLNDLYLRINENPCLSVELTSRLERLGCASINLIMLHHIIHSRAPPLIAELTIAEEILHYYYPEDYYETKADDFVHRIIDAYIASPGIYSIFKEELIVSQNNGISPQREWLEMLGLLAGYPDLGSPDESLLFGIKIKEWARIHGLFLSGAGQIYYRTDEFSEKDRRRYVNAKYPLSPKKIREEILRAAAMVGKEEETREVLTRRSTRKQLYPLLLWAAKIIIPTYGKKEEQKERLFGNPEFDGEYWKGYWNTISRGKLSFLPWKKEDGTINLHLFRDLLRAKEFHPPCIEYYKADKISIGEIYVLMRDFGSPACPCELDILPENKKGPSFGTTLNSFAFLPLAAMFDYSGVILCAALLILLTLTYVRSINQAAAYKKEKKNSWMVIIAAGGKGVRFDSTVNFPKPVHPVNGKPLIRYLIDVARKINIPSIVILDFGAPAIKAFLPGDVKWVMGSNYFNGRFSGPVERFMAGRHLLSGFRGNIILAPADIVIVSDNIIRELQKTHNPVGGKTAWCTILTTEKDDPEGKVRIIRDENNQLSGFISQTWANRQPSSIREVETGIVAVNWKIYKAMQILFLVVEPLIKFLYQTERVRNREDLDGAINKIFNYLARVLWRIGRLRIVKTSDPIGVLNINTREDAKLAEARLKEESIPAGYTPLAREYSREDIVKIWLAKVRLTQLAKGWCWRVYSTSELDCVVKVPREGLRDLAVIAANSYNKTFTIPDYAPVIKQKLGCSIADYFEIRDLKLNLNGKEVFLKRAIVQEKAAIAEQLIRRYLKEGKPQQAREVLRQCITAERRVWAAGLYHSLMDAFWFSRNLGIVESGEMVLVDGGGLFARKPARIEHFLFNNIFVPLSLSRISLSLSAQYLKEALSGSLTYDALNNIWAGKQKVQGGWMNISQLADCLNNDDYERMICQLKDLAGLSFAERIFADNWMPYLQAKAPPYQVNNLLARILVCNELSALHKASHEIFVKSNSGLVWDVLKRYAYLASPGMDVDDLFQEGSIGMLTAINKFDPRRGIRFSTYAVWWIKQAILRALNRSATVKSPEYFNNLERKIRKFIHRYEDKFGEEPLIEEIAGFMGMEADEVKKILGKRPVTFSIDEAVHGSENEPGQITRKDLLKDDSRQVEIEKMFQSSFLDGLLDQIPQQEREVVLLHYLEGKTLSEIGRMLNFSRERARQIKDAAMEKLSCLAEESPVCGLNVVIKARPRLALLKALSLLSSNSVRGVSTGKLISLITSLDLKENEGFALKPYIQFECSTGNRPRDARVVIFDWDDTLFNGVPWFELMYHLAISSIYPGATPDEKQAGYVREYLRNAAGAPFTRHLEWIQEQAASRGIKDNRTIEEHRRIFLCAVRKYIDAQHWKEQPPLLPGAKDLIIALRNKGIRLFVVSGTEHEQLRAEVEATGLTGYFDGIFGDGAFVNFNKPEAIRRIKGALNGDQVVVIGDGRHDIEAAKQAGAIAIGKINDEREKEVLINAGADCTVHDFSRSKSYLLRLLLTKSRIKKTSGGQEGAAPVAGLSAVAPAVFMYPAEQIQPVLLALLITGLVCASVIFIARNCIFSGKYAYLVKDARSLKKFLRERKRNVLSCHEGVFLGKGNYKINDYFGHKDPDLDGSIPQILKAEHDQKISAGKNIEVFPFIKDGLCPGARYLFKNCGIEEKDLIIYSEDSAIKALIQGIAGASEFVRNRLSMSLFDHFKPESEELEQLHIASTIDHHLSRVSCTSTLVAKVFRDTGVRISPSRAYLLVGGIYSDLDASLCSFNRSGFTLESTIAIDDDAEVIYWLNQIAGIKNAPEFLRELSRYEHITADSPAKDLLWDYKVFGNFSIGQDKVGADSRLTPCQLSQIREFMLQESSTRKLQAVAWMLTPMKCEEYGSSIIMRAGPSAVQSFLNVTRNSEHTRRQAIRGLFVKPVIKECLCRGHNRSAVRVIDNAIRGLECFLENKMSGEQYRMFIRMAGSYLKNNLELLHHSRASHKVTPEIEKYLKILDLNLDMAKIIKSRKIGDNFYQIDSFPAMGSRKNDIQLQLKEALRAAGKDDLQKKERRPGVLNDRSGHVLVMILPMILLLLVPVIAGVILLARSAGGMGLYVLLMLFAYVWQFYASCIWGEGKKRVAPSDAKERNAIRDQEEVPLKEAYRLCKKQETQGTERAFTLYINKDLANSVSSRDLEELKRILGSNQPAHKYNRSGQMFVQDPFRDARRQRITHLQIKGIVFDQRCALNEFSREMRRTMAYSPGDDKIGMVKVNPSAEGTMFLESALNEFLQTCDAYGSDPLARKLTVKAPIGWGEFTGVQFNGERLGFVVLGFEMGRNQRTGAERNSRVFLEKYGWAMRHLHDTGFIHSYLHLGNISLMTLPIVIHDLEG